MSQWKLPELIVYVVTDDNSLVPIGTASKTAAGIEITLSAGAHIKSAGGQGGKPNQLILNSPTSSPEASNE